MGGAGKGGLFHPFRWYMEAVLSPAGHLKRAFGFTSFWTAAKDFGWGHLKFEGKSSEMTLFYVVPLKQLQVDKQFSGAWNQNNITDDFVAASLSASWYVYHLSPIIPWLKVLLTPRGVAAASPVFDRNLVLQLPPGGGVLQQP